MSGILNIDSTIWETLYDDVIIPDLGEKAVKNKKWIIALYEKICGRWWSKGFTFRRLYSLENWFGKANYEIKQELKAIDIIQKDLSLVLEARGG